MHVPHRFSGIGTRRRCSAAPLATLTPLLSLAPGPLLSQAPDPLLRPTPGPLLSLAPGPLLSRPGHPAKPLEP
jgi:hypothetical protein